MDQKCKMADTDLGMLSPEPFQKGYNGGGVRVCAHCDHCLFNAIVRQVYTRLSKRGSQGG